MARDFYKRLGISTSVEDARRRFVKRALATVLDPGGWLDNAEARRQVAVALGVDPSGLYSVMIEDDWDSEKTFWSCLLALETGFNWLAEAEYPPETVDAVHQAIVQLLERAEVDLAVAWHKGRFHPAGAEYLDQQLVRDPLHWLGKPGWKAVADPYRKGLRHLLEARRDPEKLADVVTDLYEALESAAKIVTRRNRDLSANRELLLRQLAATDLGDLLKSYIVYANRFRHAPTLGQVRNRPVEADVETFVYLTGVFLRRVALFEQSSSEAN